MPNDHEWRGSCQADVAISASRALLGVVSAALLAGPGVGCTYTPETTVTVKDPSEVRVEIAGEKGQSLLLPPSPQEAEVPIPESAVVSSLHEKGSVQRTKAGPIVIHCSDCGPGEKTLVPLSGKITFGKKFQVAAFDFSRREMQVHFTDAREAAYGTTWTFEGDIVTPWTNVALVRRVLTPDRGLGAKLLISAGIGVALGGFALGDGVADHHPQVTYFSAVILPLAALLAIAGGWYMFAPAEEHVLFRSH